MKALKSSRDLTLFSFSRFFQFFLVKSQWNLLDSFCLFKEVYTVSLTLPIVRKRPG
jgi:hypothetical protein